MRLVAITGRQAYEPMSVDVGFIDLGLVIGLVLGSGAASATRCRAPWAVIVG